MRKPPRSAADASGVSTGTAATGTAAAAGDRNFVASLRKGLDVLTCFDAAHPRQTVSDVARLTGETPASARRSLLTLHRLGYVAWDGKLFWLLPRVLLMANAYLGSRPTPNLVQPILDALSERTRESASVAKLMDAHSIIIARSTARRSLTVGLRIGSRLPAYCSATGRVLLAALAPAEAEASVQRMPLQRLTTRTATGLATVLRRVADCRRDGFATCDGELELEVRSMAVPGRQPPRCNHRRLEHRRARRPDGHGGGAAPVPAGAAAGAGAVEATAVRGLRPRKGRTKNHTQPAALLTALTLRRFLRADVDRRRYEEACFTTTSLPLNLGVNPGPPCWSHIACHAGKSVLVWTYKPSLDNGRT